MKKQVIHIREGDKVNVLGFLVSIRSVQPTAPSGWYAVQFMLPKINQGTFLNLPGNLEIEVLEEGYRNASSN